ncbi:MAG: ATP-binding protein [bacterium]|nr:ATP-binding protein [bacterium]
MSLLQTIFSNPAFCDFEGPTYLLLGSNVPHLVYYSHIPVTIISLILGFFVFYKNRKGLPNRILFCLTLAFSAWVFLDSVFWASNRSDVIMFVWSLQILFEPIVYISGLYLLSALIKKKDIPFGQKLLIAALYIPLVLLVPTQYTLSAFNVGTCLSEEGPVALYYTYGIEIFYALWLIGLSVSEFVRAKTKDARRQILILAAGTILLLLAFSSGNIISSFTEDWQFAQIGLFAMPVFIGVLVYGIVKFKTFDIKLIGAQALIVSLVVLIGSQFFFIQNDTNRILTAITLVITGAIGINLTRSVKKEVALREKIQKQEEELEKANDRLKELDQLKSEFVSLATHQIRGPLTAIKGYASMVREGDYGAVPENLKTVIDTIYDSSDALTVVVQDFLDVSRIEQGKMKYDWSDIDFSKLVEDVATELRPNVEGKHLRLQISIEPKLIVHGDAGKLRQVIENLIDNALKYTPKGYIEVSLRRDGEKARMSIRDTGVGIKPEVIPKLFQKFSRAEDASRANLLGTGLGLYVARQLIEAQRGTVRAESGGEGKGSTFIVELTLKM